MDPIESINDKTSLPWARHIGTVVVIGIVDDAIPFSGGTVARRLHTEGTGSLTRPSSAGLRGRRGARVWKETGSEMVPIFLGVNSDERETRMSEIGVARWGLPPPPHAWGGVMNFRKELILCFAGPLCLLGF